MLVLFDAQLVNDNKILSSQTTNIIINDEV